MFLELGPAAVEAHIEGIVSEAVKWAQENCDTFSGGVLVGLAIVTVMQLLFCPV